MGALLVLVKDFQFWMLMSGARSSWLFQSYFLISSNRSQSDLVTNHHCHTLKYLPPNLKPQKSVYKKVTQKVFLFFLSLLEQLLCGLLMTGYPSPDRTSYMLKSVIHWKCFLGIKRLLSELKKEKLSPILHQRKGKLAGQLLYSFADKLRHYFHKITGIISNFPLTLLKLIE